MANIKTCIIIVGPTAVGKTALSIAIAQYFSTEIISADSRQCFIELNTGVAKPSPEELALIPHYFINSHSIHENVNAAVFEEYALKKAKQIFEKHDIAVMVGGTGLYIKAFCHGLDEIPHILPVVREKIMHEYAGKGLKWLQEEVQKNDPQYYLTGEVSNPQRLMRALEVKLSTGRSIVEYQKNKKTARDFSVIKIGLELPREILYERINNRVDTMITNGLEAEAKSLDAYKQLNALQTVGYREMFEYFEGRISFAGAIAAIKLNTRHYAKRQMTWFKKDSEVSWCAPDFGSVIQLIEDRLNSTPQF